MAGPEIRKIVDRVLTGNRKSDKYTQPSPDHYPHQWLWDSAFAAIIYARREEPETAETEIKTLLNNMNPNTGFIPNMRYHKRIKWWDAESYTFNDRSFGSSYTQPPLLAYAVWETYESFRKKGDERKGKIFLQEMYGDSGSSLASGLKRAYEYFRKYRENGNGSKLIGCIHPNETGRDSDPSLKDGAIRIPNHAIIANFLPKEIMDAANTVADSLSAARINIRAKFRHWDPEKMKKEVYWVNDVMFNVLYANSLRYMAKISNELDSKGEGQSYENLAGEIEREILEKMWNENDGFFYNLDASGRQIPIASISGLFPLALEDISEHQLISLMGKLEDPEWFKTPYPIPSLPTKSQYYDPHHDEKRLWRGPVWINANFLIAEEGIVRQIKRFLKDNQGLSERMLSYLKYLVEKTEELVEKGGLREFFDSESGKGYRIADFTISALALHFDKSRDQLIQHCLGSK